MPDPGLPGCFLPGRAGMGQLGELQLAEDWEEADSEHESLPCRADLGGGARRRWAGGGAGKVRMLDTWGAGAGDKEPMASFASWATVHRRLCYLRPFLSEALLGVHRDTGVSFMYVRIMLSLFQHRLLVSTERRGEAKEGPQLLKNWN